MTCGTVRYFDGPTLFLPLIMKTIDLAEQVEDDEWFEGDEGQQIYQSYIAEAQA